MGKSGKLFKTLLGGVKAFRSSSTETSVASNNCPRSAKENDPTVSNEKWRWSLGKSVPRDRNLHISLPSVDLIDVEEITVVPSQSSAETNASVPQDYEDFTDKAAAAVHGHHSIPSPTLRDQFAHAKAIQIKEMPQCEWAATRIQTAFRGYTCRRALRALKGLVRLQALVRGRLVRKQAARTLKCMRALVKVQAHVRARRVRMSAEGQAVRWQLQRRKQLVLMGEWDNSSTTIQQLQAKAQYRQVAIVKRERARAYAFYEQLRRCADRKQSSLVLDCELHKRHWGWDWLERWMAAKPWESSFPPRLCREHLSVMNVRAPRQKTEILNTTPELPKRFFNKKRSLSISGSISSDSPLSPCEIVPPSVLSANDWTLCGSDRPVTSLISRTSMDLERTQQLPNTLAELVTSIAEPLTSAATMQSMPLEYPRCAKSISNDVNEFEGSDFEIIQNRRQPDLIGLQQSQNSDTNIPDGRNNMAAIPTHEAGRQELGIVIDRMDSCDASYAINGRPVAVMSWKVAVKRGDASEQTSFSAMPSYMQSTQSTKAKVGFKSRERKEEL